MRVHLVSDKEDATAKFGDHQVIMNFRNQGTNFVVEGVKLDKDMDEYYHESGDPKFSYGQMKQPMMRVVKYNKRGLNKTGRTYKNYDVKLQLDDEIKMGKIRFRVKKVFI